MHTCIIIHTDNHLRNNRLHTTSDATIWTRYSDLDDSVALEQINNGLHRAFLVIKFCTLKISYEYNEWISVNLYTINFVVIKIASSISHSHALSSTCTQNIRTSLSCCYWLRREFVVLSSDTIWFARREFWVSAQLARVHFRDIVFADFSTREMNPGLALRTLDHWSSCIRLHTETCDQFRLFLWKRKQVNSILLIYRWTFWLAHHHYNVCKATAKVQH